MDAWQAVIYIVVPVLLGYIGYNERDKGTMKQKMDKTLCKNEVEHLIDLKNKPMEVLQNETSDDVKECKLKLDKLEDLMRELNSSK
jgi:hypothetical protein